MKLTKQQRIEKLKNSGFSRNEVKEGWETTKGDFIPDKLIQIAPDEQFEFILERMKESSFKEMFIDNKKRS